MNRESYYVLHLYVSGSVQGVGFRFFAIHIARSFGITGWVKNLYDGRVEIEAEGLRSKLSGFLKEIKIGPPSAHVSNIVEEWHEIALPRYKEFSIRY